MFCSLPAQTRQDMRRSSVYALHLCHYQVIHSLDIVYWWLVLSLRPRPAKTLSFYFWVKVGVFSHYHIYATTNWWKKNRGCWPAIKVHNWSWLDHRKEGQDRKVNSNKNVYWVCKAGIQKTRKEREQEYWTLAPIQWHVGQAANQREKEGEGKTINSLL